MYPYALIGNCQISALVGERGSIDWLCLPRPDSPPVFGKLLDAQGGSFLIEAQGQSQGTQSYIPNTNVLVTRVRSDDGSEFQITDFCPRFSQHGRMYRPMALFRIVEPLTGAPHIRIRCQPVNGWSKEPLKPTQGNSHLRYEAEGQLLRLTTNMSLTYLQEDAFVALKEPLFFALTSGLGIEDNLPQVSRRFLEQTIDYWNTWVKHCSIPTDYQKETIRSALTLKLHCYEDTGAILAALTTSLPEEDGSGRNWDYRFCWLRDSYFALNAFHRLGHFEEMEGFIKFLLGVAEKHDHSRERLRPVYRLDQSLPLPEIEHTNWSGFGNNQPVRSNNQAAEHIQNDVYGEMVLTLAPIFFDERFHHLRTQEHERLLVRLAKLCAQTISQPDAGLWELRNGWQEHSFSNLMCWAGLDRIHRIHGEGFLREIDFDLAQAKDKAERAIQAAVREGSLRNTPQDESYDAALLLLPILNFPDAKVSKKTVEKAWGALRLSEDSNLSSFLYRYKRRDDFGMPQSAFMICSFWLVQALARVQEKKKAQEVMRCAMTSATSLGLFSEHYIPHGNRQTGNFPQAYSHVGQINAAFAISSSWDDVL